MCLLTVKEEMPWILAAAATYPDEIVVCRVSRQILTGSPDVQISDKFPCTARCAAIYESIYRMGIYCASIPVAP